MFVILFFEEVVASFVGNILPRTDHRLHGDIFRPPDTFYHFFPLINLTQLFIIIPLNFLKFVLQIIQVFGIASVSHFPLFLLYFLQF